MTQVMSTVLKGASGGFGEYDWVEAAAVEDGYGDRCETLSQYEAVLDAADVEWERTNEISGRIHREYGQVYKINPNDPETFEYHMVWVDEAAG